MRYGDRLRIEVELPIHIVSVANKREHWGARARRAQTHRRSALLVPKLAWRFPVEITLTRLGGRQMDDDNLVAAFKALRDGIAARLGLDDADPRLRWRYEQEPHPHDAVSVTLAEMEAIRASGSAP